ncbi:hypothetical protein D3C78_1163990 [compost metagenome]
MLTIKAFPQIWCRHRLFGSRNNALGQCRNVASQPIDEIIEFGSRQCTIDPSVTFRRSGVDQFGTQDHFKRTTARHPAGQILGSATAGRDTHQGLTLGKPRQSLGGKRHVGRRNKLGTTAACQPGKLDDRDLRLLPQKLAERLERIKAFWSMACKLIESVRLID